MAKKANRGKAFSAPDSFFQRWKYHLLAFAFSFLIYANTIPNEYNMDDELVTSISPAMRHPLTSKGIRAIPEIFRTSYYSDEQGYAYEYRPIVLVSFAIEHSLFGDNPHAGHFINVLLYSLLCMLVLSVLNLLLKNYNLLLPLLVTLFFAAFPMHTEVVASLKNRDEILALTGGVASLYFFIQYAEKGRIPLLLTGVLCFAAAMLSKQTVISFAVIIPVMLLLFREMSLPRITLVSAGLSAVIFPMIQRGLLMERVAVTGAVFLFALAVHEIRYRTLVKAIFAPKRSLKADLSGAHSKVVPNTQPDDMLMSKTVFIVLTAVLSTASILSLVSGSVFYLIPLTLLIPVFAFAPFRKAGYFQLPGAAIVIFLAHQTEIVMLFNLYFLGWIYRFFSKKRWGSFETVISIIILLMGLVAGYFIPIEPFVSLTVLAGVVAMSYKPQFKKLIKILVLLIITIWSLGKLADPFVWVQLVLVFLVLYFPQRKRIIFSGVALSILLLVTTTFYSDYQLREVKRSILQAGRDIKGYPYVSPVQKIGTSAAFRPVDYAESVINANSTLSEKLGTGMMIIGKYLRLTVIPYPMSFYYGYKCIEKAEMTQPLPLAIFVSILATMGIALYHLNKNLLLSAGLFIYFTGIFPVANIIVPVSGMVGERYLFIPSIGFCMLLSLLLFRLTRMSLAPSKGTLFASVSILKYPVIVILLLYSGLTIARNAQWKDSLTLMRHDVKHLNKSAQAHNLLGTHLARKALQEKNPSQKSLLLEEAERHFETAVNIYPEFFNAWYDLGRVRLLLGKINEAEQPFLKVIAMDSTFSEPFFHVGLIKENKGDYAGAVNYYMRYLKNNPGNPDALMNMGFCLARLNDYPRALAYMKTAAAWHPQKAEPLINISRLFANMGLPDSAIIYLHKAEVLSPRHPDIPPLKDAFFKSGFYNRSEPQAR